MTDSLTFTPSHTHLGGADLYTMQMHRCKTARLSVFVAMPADPQKSPLATLLFGVLRRGSTGYPRLAAINRRLDELYGSTLTIRNHLYGDRHVLSFTVEMLEDAFLAPADRGRMNILGGAMEVLAELMLHPLTDADGCLRHEAVEAEKAALCDLLRSELNDPRSYAANRLRCLMCEGEPYGVATGGTVEQVEAMTAADVTHLWQDILSTAMCTFFYVGRATADTVKAAWDMAFSGWMSVPRCLPPTRPHLVPTAPRRVEEEHPVGQGHLCMAWTTPTVATSRSASIGERDDYAAMLVLNELWGGMPASLLFRYVRETKGLCYECETMYDSPKGILTVTCGIRPDRCAEAEVAIHQTVERMRQGQVNDEEVDMAVASLVCSYRQVPDSPSFMESFWLEGHLLGLTETPTDLMERVMAVTASDVTEAACRLTLDTVYFLKGTRPDVDEAEEVYEP